MNRVLLYWKIKGYLRQSDASIPADTLLAILSTLFPCRTMCAFDVVSVLQLSWRRVKPTGSVYFWLASDCLPFVCTSGLSVLSVCCVGRWCVTFCPIQYVLTGLGEYKVRMVFHSWCMGSCLSCARYQLASILTPLKIHSTSYDY